MVVTNSDAPSWWQWGSDVPSAVRVVMVFVVGEVPWVAWRRSWTLHPAPEGVAFESDLGVDFVSLRLFFGDGVVRGSSVTGYQARSGFTLDLGDPECLVKLVGCVRLVFPMGGVVNPSAAFGDDVFGSFVEG